MALFAFPIVSWSTMCIEITLYTGTVLTIKYSEWATCNKPQLYWPYTVQQCQLLNVAIILSNLIDRLTIIINILTYLLTPWCRVLEKLNGLQLVKKFPAFHGTRRFITALTSVRHLSLSWAYAIQSIYPHPTSWRSILILSTHLYLGLPSGLFPSGFPSKTLYTPLSLPIRATCPAHLILLDFITRTILGEECRSFLSSLLTAITNNRIIIIIIINIDINEKIELVLLVTFLFCFSLGLHFLF